MLSAQIEQPGLIRVVDKQIPAPGDDSILIRVMACAICGSDVRIYKRGDPRAKYPIVPGHEVAGVVEAVGRNVRGFREGDRVCAAPGHGCGRCKYCLGGHSNVCTAPCPSMGYAADGGLAEYLVPPENIVRLGFVNRIPDGVCFEEASMSELLACCINGQENAPVRPGDTVLIIGAGPAGCLHIELSRLHGASKILLAQRSVHRLELARRFRPDRTISTGEEDLAEAVREETDGLGADVVFVCAPSRAAQEQALALAAPRGRVNFFGGLPKDDRVLTTDANVIHYKELFVSGASSSLARHNREALDLIAAHKINAACYITHRFPLEDIGKAFQTVIDKEAIKAVVTPRVAGRENHGPEAGL